MRYIAGVARSGVARWLVVLLPVGCSLVEPLVGVRPDTGHGGNGAGTGVAGTNAGAGDSGADPCLGVMCNTPPPASCQGNGELEAYDSVGSCSAGSCTYTSRAVACDCAADACTSDPCLSVVCASPPSPSCTDPSTLTTYAAVGTCTGGGCSYTATTTSCASGCTNGACNDGSCVGVRCSTPPATTCSPTGERRTFAAVGTCSGGVCSYPLTDTPCGSNQQCLGTACAICSDDASCGPSCTACAGSTPKCALFNSGSASSCVGCLTSADCGGTTTGCNTNTHTCAQASCIGLAATCGPSGNGDCCASSVVTGGTFYRSYDGVTAGYTSQAFPATVSDFRLDTYEITVGRFRKFTAAYSQAMIAAGAGANPNNPADIGWDTTWNGRLPADLATLRIQLASCAALASWTITAGTAAAESRPINCLDWFEAEAFCIWDGGRLPTEAEWNYAASGGAEQRAYPWGGTAPGANANLADYGCYYPSGSGSCTGLSNLAKVGSISAGNGKWGQADLAGNVWEWVQDWYVDPYSIASCSNCADLTSSPYRVLRGGGFDGTVAGLFSSDRTSFTASERTGDAGARCARSAP